MLTVSCALQCNSTCSCMYVKQFQAIALFSFLHCKCNPCGCTAILGKNYTKLPEIASHTYGLLTKPVRSRWLDIGQVEVHKLAKKERGQYPAILTEQAWSIKDLLYGFRGNFSCGIRRVVPSGQDSSILPAHGASHIINTFSPRAHYARGM